jgi:hypothetical protein
MRFFRTSLGPQLYFLHSTQQIWHSNSRRHSTISKNSARNATFVLSGDSKSQSPALSARSRVRSEYVELRKKLSIFDGEKNHTT